MTTIFELMSADHEKLDSLFDEFRALKESDPSEARDLFLDFEARLQTHIVCEEDILFPIFERETGMRDFGPTAMMRLEHRHIRDFLAKIGEHILAGETAELDLAMVGLLGILGSHNQKEENILYPAIDNLVSEQEKEQAISKMVDPGSKVFS